MAGPISLGCAMKPLALLIVFVLACASGIGLTACGGPDYKETLAKCRADRSISLSPRCRDARNAAFHARFGSRG